MRGNTDSSKRITYMKMNPSFSQHKVYESEHVPEYMRISFTRFRLSSHELNIEKGRWSRVPKENRKCLCDQDKIQTTHINEHFNITQNTLKDFLEMNNEITIANVIHQLLQYFERN